jgi:hypothetical protein
MICDAGTPHTLPCRSGKSLGRPLVSGGGYLGDHNMAQLTCHDTLKSAAIFLRNAIPKLGGAKMNVVDGIKVGIFDVPSDWVRQARQSLPPAADRVQKVQGTLTSGLPHSKV